MTRDRSLQDIKAPVLKIRAVTRFGVGVRQEGEIKATEEVGVQPEVQGIRIHTA